MDLLLEPAEASLIVKNSRFLAELFPVSSQAEAREMLRLAKEKYSDATHVVHAFVVGPKAETKGMSDDGEPGGTAGRPVLDVLSGSGLTNCILTVTRWFGGTLLGTGGLVKAYGDSAKAVIALCRREPLVEKKLFSFTADYALYESLKRQFSAFHISSVKEEYAATVTCSGQIWAGEGEAFAALVKDFSRGLCQIELRSVKCI